MSAWTTCSIQMIEMPVARTSLMRSTSAAVSCSTRPPATSSSRSTRGPVASARASSSRLRSSSVRLRRGGWPCRRGRSAPAVRRSRHRRRARSGRRRTPRPPTRFSNTVMPPNGCGIWNERARPMRQRCSGFMRVTSWPSNTTRAGVGRDRAGDDAEQRGLAGAVRPDDAQRLAAQEREVDVVGDHDGAEAFGDFFEGEDGGHQGAAGLGLFPPPLWGRAREGVLTVI